MPKNISDQNEAFFLSIDIFQEIEEVSSVFPCFKGVSSCLRRDGMMEQDSDLCTLVVRDSSRCLIARRLDQNFTLTLVALVSEDPSNWDEAMSAWPRYRSQAVCESASELPLEAVSPDEAMECLAVSDSWIVIDYQTKRIFHGGSFEPIGSNAAFDMVSDTQGQKVTPVCIHLPPWWELHEGVSLVAVTEPRRHPIQRPVVDREILYGDAFMRDIALGSLEAIADFRQDKTAFDRMDTHAWIVRLHREWLMTPREDLGGKTPRELLHGAIHWSDRVTEGQQIRYCEGSNLIALPKDWSGYATAPMGSQEMCMYFDFCRAMIRSAWDWCLANEQQVAIEDRDVVLSRLIQSLRQTKQTWLSNPFEGGPNPELIIECDRRRVPIADGVMIEGVNQVPRDSHKLDCNCPICAMIADGLFGTSFIRLGGYHLEFDDEFAFSMTQTWEEWESEHRLYDEFQESCQAASKPIGPVGPDEDLRSAWMGIGSQRPIPRDQQGDLKMAFMVAEMVGVLEAYPNRLLEIQSLNIAFTRYRRSKGRRRKKGAKKLKTVLETIAGRCPELVSKSADLQSYIDESTRVLASD